MIVFLILLAAVLSAGAGAVLGRSLAIQHFESVAGEPLDTAKAAAGRANVASAKIEAIAPEWPPLLERVENLDSRVRTFVLVAQAAERQSAETAARQVELEQAIAGAFSITLVKR